MAGRYGLDAGWFNQRKQGSIPCPATCSRPHRLRHTAVWIPLATMPAADQPFRGENPQRLHGPFRLDQRTGHSGRIATAYRRGWD